ncbi:serine hydrolase-like protein 2 [Hyposmocoma kahamanoa]|uniref:serine hydrolase-like protein 2 n=1 Tax=Hyposmocoma kahamanoa TaxID=1477025 RepID=UPI000E6D9A8A|nr:serine hydrolase-like protein 2 [Hyposmocoma kahamanoa]
MSLQEKEWFMEAPWGRMCIVAWGDCSDPPVLVVHGHLDSAASFRPLLKLLPRKFYYIGLELPGHGKSDPYPPGLMINVLDFVYPIEIVRRHFRWETFVYIAHSVSTTIGRFYQLAYPNRMSKVVEIDQIWPKTIDPEDFANWYDKSFTSYFKRYDHYNMSKEKRPTHTWQEAIEKLCKNRNLTPETARATLERFSEPADERNHLIRYTFDERTKLTTRPVLSTKQIKNLYAKITTPTLAVISKGSIQKGFYQTIPFLLEEELENYKVVKVEGHHDVFITNPERMAPCISKFLLTGLDGMESKSKL